MKTRVFSLGLILLGAAQLEAGPPPRAPTRPALEMRQGRFFRWAAPPGWRVNETSNGVDLTSPDGRTIATSAILLRSPGSTTPTQFILAMIPRVPGFSGFRVLSTTNLPPQGGFLVQRVECAYAANGVPVRASYTAAVRSMMGMSFDAAVVGYHAPAGEFDRARDWLARVAADIQITNTAQVAGNDQIMPAQNHPLDNSGLLESWRQKGLSEDRISKARREATMGYERVRDSDTGQVYEMPLEAWDGTRGGYVNPQRPTELLDPTQPGE